MITLNMSGIAIIVLVFILLFCFAPLISTIFKINQKRLKNTQYVMHSVKMLSISYWDYLVIIIPIGLLLIILFTPNQEEQAISLIGLGIGYTMLIISPYNRRIDKPKANLLLLLTSVFLAVVATISFLGALNLYVPNITMLYWPLIAYLYLIIARQIIKLLTGSFPITLDNSYGVGMFHEQYNRKTNHWDLLWTMFNHAIVATLLIFWIN